MNLTLYNFAASTCSQAVRFVLHEKGLRFEDHIMNSPAGEHLREPYLSLNPSGVVPTLVHDGAPVCDSTVIMEYLDEIAPQPAMVPADTLGRAKMREWLRYFEEVPHPSIRYPSFHYFIGKKLADKSKAELEAFAARHPIRKDFYSEMSPQGFTPDKVAAAEERLTKCLDRVEKTLSAPGHAGPGEGPWLMGAQLTIADACLMPVLDRMNDLGMAHLWDNGARPGIARWYAEIRKRPAFAATYYEGARLSENYGAPRNR
ncbi:MAG: glutathione S-transferase family protein [Hyphomicrobiales bacterium]|nr:glutathione S-transferase family protein [Hyphomicrobiales bacterium]